MNAQGVPFSGKDYKDDWKHIDEVLDIDYYFNAPNVSRHAILLRMLLVTFTRDEKIWLKSLAPGTIRTWDNLREEFIEQFRPPSKISKLKKKIETSNKKS